MNTKKNSHYILQGIAETLGNSRDVKRMVSREILIFVDNENSTFQEVSFSRWKYRRIGREFTDIKELLKRYESEFIRITFIQ